MHNCNTLEHHWKATGRPLETHWLPTIISPVAFQCTLGSKFQAHWNATGMPLNYHWFRVRGAIMQRDTSGLFPGMVRVCLYLLMCPNFSMAPQGQVNIKHDVLSSPGVSRSFSMASYFVRPQCSPANEMAVKYQCNWII